MSISSKDDPVCNRECIPFEEIKKNINIITVETDKGGHIDFLETNKASRWAPGVALNFLNLLTNWLIQFNFDFYIDF